MKAIAVKTKSLSDIAKCDDVDSLLECLRLCATDILTNLERLAAIVKRLDELGARVDIDESLLPYVRLIATGKLSAQCFIACTGDQRLLSAAIRMPLSVQQEIADDKEFEVLRDTGKVEKISPLNMNARDIQQVFGGNKPRTRNEQLEWLGSSKRKSDALRLRVTSNHPSGSAMLINLDWAAKKVVAAAVNWHANMNSTSDMYDESVCEALGEAIEEYLELKKENATETA